MFRTFLRVLEATLHGFPQGAMQKCSVGSMLGGVALGRAVQAWAGYVRGPRGRTATNVVRRQRQR